MNSSWPNQMRLKHRLCDTVIKVDGASFYAQKLVLSKCSSFFRDLFIHCPSPTDHVLFVPGVSGLIMKDILRFAYTGQISVTEANIQELFIAADRYDVTGITQACCKVMEEKLSPQTCINTWRLTHTFYYPELRHKAFFHLLEHFQEVVASSKNFLQLSVKELFEIIKHDQLNVKEESAVFEAVLCWVAHSPQDREEYFFWLFPQVRLCLMPSQYLLNSVTENELVRASSDCKLILVLTMKLMLDARIHEVDISRNPLARPRLPQAALLAIGGWSRRGITNVIETYNVRSDRWVVQNNPDVTPRAFHGTVFLNGSVYCMGGFSGAEHFSTTFKYDLVARTWQEVAPMHSRRAFISVTLLNGYIYAIGGFDGQQQLKSAERYTSETNTWTHIASMNKRRAEAGCTSLRGRIYICGGFARGQHRLTAECYCPVSNQWTSIANMSCRRSGVGVMAYANQVYAVGGITGRQHLQTVEAYNPETNTWQAVQSMEHHRKYFALGVLDGRLFVVGGFSGLAYVKAVECFDVKTGVWSEVRGMKVGRHALSCCVVYDLPNMADYTDPYLNQPKKEDGSQEE